MLVSVACSDSGEDTTMTTSDESDPTIENPTTGVEMVCMPGVASCKDEGVMRVCNPDGLTYIDVLCEEGETCSSGRCLGPCDYAEESPSSVGCSFFAARMTHWRENSPDALIIGNTDRDKTATIQLWYVPDNLRQEFAQGDPVQLAPGETRVFEMTNSFVDQYSSGYRLGGLYRVESDIPIVAYQHSPLENSSANDSSMLLPEHALRKEYIVYSYPGFQDKNDEDINGHPSYFTVLALDYDTTVTWTPPVATDETGFKVKYVKAGAQGSVVMDKYELMQIAAADVNGDWKRRDVSGTIIESDKPIWVVGATACAFVPYEGENPGVSGQGFCDHLQEQLIPLDHWGRRYVGIHAKLRQQERRYWRVFAGEDDTKVWVIPQQGQLDEDGAVISLAKKGDFYEFSVDSSWEEQKEYGNKDSGLIFISNKKIMPVQYIAGAQELTWDEGSPIGDPSMYAMVPVEQYLKRYAFTTGQGYRDNYVQIVHRKGGAPVYVDDVEVTGYTELGPEGDEVPGLEVETYEIVSWPVNDGAHFAQSDDKFGITNIGYADPNFETKVGFASYAYPGGMALEVIAPS
ncbi:MAG: IgGFc-binding protein, partial [Myxococcales bacterium]|nr:IgGFc-binding protein [Myxococcales bacterium]